MLTPETILKELRITEKSSSLTANLNKYTFEVALDANRRSVAAAIEHQFGVTVTQVNIINRRGKLKRSRTVRGAFGRTKTIKKAIVTLQAGDVIQLG